jgi:hypothetical protein
MASLVDRVEPAGQAEGPSMTRGSIMTYRRTSAAIAVLLGLALYGCQPAAGPLPVESSAAAVPSPSSAELTAIIQTAVETETTPSSTIPRLHAWPKGRGRRPT